MWRKIKKTTKYKRIRNTKHYERNSIAFLLINRIYLYIFFNLRGQPSPPRYLIKTSWFQGLRLKKKQAGSYWRRKHFGKPGIWKRKFTVCVWNNKETSGIGKSSVLLLDVTWLVMMEVPWITKRSLRGQVMPLLLLLLHLRCSALPLTGKCQRFYIYDCIFFPPPPLVHYLNSTFKKHFKI